MATEINGLSGALFAGAHERRDVTPVNREPNKQQHETGKPSTGDTISLTESAKQLYQLEEQINAQPVVDIQRVDKAKQDIANGHLDISPSTIAQKLTMFERLLPA